MPLLQVPKYASKTHTVGCVLFLGSLSVTCSVINIVIFGSHSDVFINGIGHSGEHHRIEGGLTICY